jgi:cellulose synthase/poly-beta-1,6-N-acetylglucosamine synthase-like glycosyltransferase
VLDLFEIGLSTFIAIPSIVFFVEIISSLFAKPNSTISAHLKTMHDFVVLIPAHNEASGIQATVQALTDSRYSVLVVADNCTDDTALIARQSGATVIERSDTELRGKGFALDFGIRWLGENPPQALVVLDADCVVQSGNLQSLVAVAMSRQCPVQAHDSMVCLPNASAKTNIAAFAWLVKNYVRPLGLRQLGLPCQLMGTGMAFPWTLIRNARLASSESVEDLKLGLDFASEGKFPMFCTDVEIRSYFPEDSEGQKSQRSRWESGHLRTIFQRGPQFFLRSFISGNWKAAAMAIDMMVPPIAFLVLFLFIAITCGSVIFLLTGLSGLLMSALSSLFMMLVATLIAWRVFGSEVLPARALLAIPIYVLSKLPLYATIFSKTRRAWVRTKRDKE